MGLLNSCFSPQQSGLKQHWPGQCLGCRNVQDRIQWGSISHSNRGGRYFYYVFCRVTNHQKEKSEVIFRLYFLPHSSISICITLLKNNSSSVHEALDSLQLACWYLTEPLTHCCELEEMLQNLLQSLLLPPFGVGKGRKRRGSFNQVLTIT